MLVIAPWLRTGQRPENEDSAQVVGPAGSRKLKMYFCSEPTFKLGSNEGQRHEQTITLMSLPKSFRGSFCKSQCRLYGCVVKLWWCKWYYFLNSQLLADARWDGLMLTSSHPGPCRESWCHDIWGVESWLTLSHLYPILYVSLSFRKNDPKTEFSGKCKHHDHQVFCDLIWGRRTERYSLWEPGPDPCRHGGVTAAARAGQSRVPGSRPWPVRDRDWPVWVGQPRERHSDMGDTVTTWGHDPCPSDNTHPRPGPGRHWPQWRVSRVPQGGRGEDRDQTHHRHQPLHRVHLHRGPRGVREQAAQLPRHQRLLQPPAEAARPVLPAVPGLRGQWHEAGVRGAETPGRAEAMWGDRVWWRSGHRVQGQVRGGAPRRLHQVCAAARPLLPRVSAAAVRARGKTDRGRGNQIGSWGHVSRMHVPWGFSDVQHKDVSSPVVSRAPPQDSAGGLLPLMREADSDQARQQALLVAQPVPRGRRQPPLRHVYLVHVPQISVAHV